MSQQQVLAVTPVVLNQQVNGETIDKGNCACAIIGFPSNPPRFALVCYDDKRQTHCTATIGSSNERSLKFAFTTNDYATFSDNKGEKFGAMFMKSAEVDKFIATLGAAFYAAGGAPSHSSVVGDFGAASAGAPRLDLSQRCKVRYNAFVLNRGASGTELLRPGKLVETNGDRPYNFHPVSSAGALLPEFKGFESSVLGMAEEGRRVVVIPGTMPRSGSSPFGDEIVAFSIELTRILPDDANGAAGAVVAVPTVFGEQEPPAPETNGAASTALALVPAESEPKVEEVPNSTAKGTAGGVGSGIPAEHMGMIQNAGSKINSATTATRDLHDKIVAFQDDWKQVINRPKPSALTAEALEQHIKSMLMDHERVTDEIARRDELIRSIDERNRDLQKRVDRAAMVAQQLMDEKQKTVSSGSDERLAKDREVMKVQEQITRASSERDDIQRHLATIKKLLDVSDAELRDTKGKAEVLKVSASSVAGKLDVVEDQLAEERSRRKALEAKAAALQDEIRNAEADLHLKSSEVEDILRKADSERMHMAQLMEDERARRQFEAQQLRGEIVTELQQREDKFQADRARVAEDNFSRGHDEGKEIGRRNARIDVETRLQELQLDAQRAKTALDAYKTELRSANEDSMAENRRLEAIVTQLKKDAEDSTRQKATREYQLHQLQSKAKNAEDALFLSFTNAVHRLTRPASSADLVELLNTLRERRTPTFAFQRDSHEAEATEAYARRQQWIVEELELQYGEVLEESYQEEYLNPLEAALTATQEAVRLLWEERDRAIFGSLFDDEKSGRTEAEAEETAEFTAIEEHLAEVVAAQNAIVAEEEAARQPIEEEGIEGFAAVEELRDAEAAARNAVVDEADTANTTLEEEEAGEFKTLRVDFETVVFAGVIAAQTEVIEEETAARQEVEQEADKEFEEFAEPFAASAKEAEEKQAAREAEEAAEAEAAAAKAAEEEAAKKAEEEAAAAAAKEEAARKAAEEEAAKKAEEEAAAAAAKAEEEEEAKKAEEEAARKATEERAAKPADSPIDDPLGAGSSAPAPDAPRAAPSTFDDSDDDGPLGIPPKAKPSAANSDTKKKAMFGSDSDSDDAAPAPKPAAKKAASPASKRPVASNMFGSDSDSDGAAPAPKRAPAKRPAPKAKAKMFDSDSD